MSLQDAAIAANRFGLGARPGELSKIKDDPRGWLRAQLTPETALPAPLAALPSTADDQAAFTNWLAGLHLDGQDGAALKAYTAETGAGAMAAAKPGDGAAMAPDGGKLSVEQSYVRTLLPRYATALQARIDVATATDRPFFERLAHFWSNHFTVSAAKPEVIAMPAAFECDVVRPHVTGRFEDMLLASSQHPAMLLYLDNWSSIGPGSVLASHPEYLPPYLRKRMAGLNENLAREILELHTLGVRSGYTQTDVTTFAKIITGWSVRNARQGPGPDGRMFHFLDAAHEPGTQELLGISYPQGGVAQGEAALRALARHPATADHIATKLARHFVADDPPPAAVAKLSKVFRDTNGDLGQVSAALIELPEAWAPAPAKLKPPEDYVVSAMRAMGGPKLKGFQLTALFDRMGQKPWFAPGPDGWADVAGNWIGPDPVWKRIEWADAAGKAMATAGLDPAVLAKEALGPNVSPATLEAIRRAESPAQGLSLLLASADFQRR